MKIYFTLIRLLLGSYICIFLFSYPIKAKAQLSAQPAQKELLSYTLLERSAKEIILTIQQQEKNEKQQSLLFAKLTNEYYGIYGAKKKIVILEKLMYFINENNICNDLSFYILNGLADEYLIYKIASKDKIVGLIASCEQKFLQLPPQKNCNSIKYLLICAQLNENNLLQCKKYLDKAYKEAKKYNCYDSMIGTLLCKSIILYERQNNYLETLNTRLQAIQLLDSFEREKKLNVDYLYKIDIYERTANLHYKVGNYELARKKWSDCLDLLSQNNAPKSRVDVFVTNNVGLCHLKMNDFEKALTYFETTVALSKATKDTVWIGIANGNIGDLFVTKKEYKKALPYLNEDANTSIKYNEYDNATKTFLQIAECYLNLEDTTKARLYIENTEKMLVKHKAFIQQRQFNDIIQIQAKLHKNWLNYYIKTNNKTLAQAYFKSFLSIQDSINKFRKGDQLFIKQNTYDNEHQKDQQRIKELENEQISLKTIIFIVAFGSLCLVGLVFVRYSRIKIKVIDVKNKQLVAIAQANSNKINDLEIIEEQNKSITASIEYAKIIQQSILPSQAYANKILGNKTAFVIYQPKDIVSGDFYWIQQKQEKIIIVLSDCTGHGVPGAMMSMLANELLHKRISQKNILAPEIMLKDIYMTLKKRLNMKETKRYDGMDIAMLVYDKNTKILDFASVGSVSACYVKDNIVTEFPRNKVYVPMLLVENTEIPNFEKFSITLNKTTQFYMFSDGITDQFDSTYKKKFGRKKFNELLQNLQEIPINEQKHHIETVMNDWKKDAPQTDDISLLAFEINV